MLWLPSCFDVEPDERESQHALAGRKGRKKVPVLTGTLIINKKVNILLLAVKGISAGSVIKMRFKPKPDWPLDA